MHFTLVGGSSNDKWLHTFWFSRRLTTACHKLDAYISIKLRGVSVTPRLCWKTSKPTSHGWTKAFKVTAPKSKTLLPSWRNILGFHILAMRQGPQTSSQTRKRGALWGALPARGQLGGNCAEPGRQGAETPALDVSPSKGSGTKRCRGRGRGKHMKPSFAYVIKI